MRAGLWTSAAAAPSTSRATAVSTPLDLPSSVACARPWHGSLGVAAVDCREGEWAGSLAILDCSRGRKKKLFIVGRAGGSRPPAGARKPRVATPRRPPQEETSSARDGVLINGEIRLVMDREFALPISQYFAASTVNLIVFALFARGSLDVHAISARFVCVKSALRLLVKVIRKLTSDLVIARLFRRAPVVRLLDAKQIMVKPLNVEFGQ